MARGCRRSSPSTRGCRRSASCSTSCATPSCASRRCGCGSRSAPGPRAAKSSTLMDTVLRHPGDAKVTTTRPGDGARTEYEVWISDGELVRTYSSAHRLGTQRPIRNRPRGLDDRDFPGTAKVYEPMTALPAETLPETFVHPAGYCQNVLATGRCMVTRHRRRDRARGDPARVRPPAHDRAVRRPAGLPHLDRGRSRDRADPATGRDDRRRDHPRTPRSSSCRPTSRCHRPRSTSSSPPGRRCSTEPRPFLGARLDAYHRPGFLTSFRKEGKRPDPRRRARRIVVAHRPPSSSRHLAFPRVSRAAPRSGCSRRSCHRPR